MSACGSGANGTSTDSKKAGPAQQICAAAATADITPVLGAAAKGSAKDVPSGHGCVLAVVVYDRKADLPSGEGAAKSLADAVGLDTGGFSASSIATTAGGKKPVALLLSTGALPADSDAQRRITDAAVAAG